MVWPKIDGENWCLELDTDAIYIFLFIMRAFLGQCGDCKGGAFNHWQPTRIPA